MRKFIFTASALLLITLASCHHKHEEEEETKYVVTNPLELDTFIVKEYVAQIKSVQNIEIRAQEKGFLQKIYVDEGQFVKKGQLLFKIMPNISEAEVEKAKAEVEAAEVEFQNTKLLSDKEIVSPNELAVAKAKLQQAKATLKLANTHLAFTDIKAPFDGILDRFPKRLGSLIDEGELLTSLSDNSNMYVYFNVSEPEYLNYMMHKDDEQYKQVRLLLANGEEFNVPGIVETVEGEFDPETGNIAFRAKFQNLNRILKNGETGKVLMSVAIKNKMVIPQKATYELQDKKYVFIVDKDNKVVAKEIKIIASLSNLYVIESNLSINDKILFEGIQKVKEDDVIKYEEKDARTLLSNLNLKAE